MKFSMGHVAFAVTDLDRSLDFYCNKLGFKKGFALLHENGDVWLQYVEFAPHEYLELFPETSVKQYDDAGFKHMAIMVDDIRELMVHLKAQGLALYDGPVKSLEANDPLEIPITAPCNSYTGWLADPDGNFIEFMQFTPDSLHLHPDRW